MSEIETDNTGESAIDPSTELLVIKVGDSKISKTSQVKATKEILAVEYRPAVHGSQEITITAKDEATAHATIDRLYIEGYTAHELDGSLGDTSSVNGGMGPGGVDKVDSPAAGEGVGTVTDGEATPGTRTLRVSLEPGKDNLAAFREAFKRTKHKNHGNKTAIEAGKTTKQAEKAQATEQRARAKELKAEEKRTVQEKKDVASLDAIKNKERDRVLKEKIAENQRLEVRIKQDEATLKAIKGLIGKRGYSSPEADEEIEQRVTALAADKETLAMNKRAIKKEEDSRLEPVVQKDKDVIEDFTLEPEEGFEEASLQKNMSSEDEPHGENPTYLDDDLDGFGTDDDSGDELTDDGMLAGM